MNIETIEKKNKHSQIDHVNFTPKLKN